MKVIAARVNLIPHSTKSSSSVCSGSATRTMWRLGTCVVFALICESVSIFVSPDAPRSNKKYEALTGGSNGHVPGQWATPSPDSGIHLGFTPIQTYASVRRSNSVEHLPRSEAYKESTSPDEMKNAHRLREVLRTKKIQEVYSEEGYEDSAYDHGNHERHAEFEEKYTKNEKGKHRGSKKHAENVADSKDSESRNQARFSKKRKPEITKKKIEEKKVKFSYEDDKKTSSEKIRPANKSRKPAQPKFDSEHLSSSRFSTWQSPLASTKKTEKENLDSPNFRYIHSLTDAHFGHNKPTQRETKSIPSKLISMSQEFFNPKEYSGFEPKRISKRIKRDDSSEYENELRKELDEEEKKIITAALQNVEFPEFMTEIKPPLVNTKETWTLDHKKYPYYNAQLVDPYSPLKYASDPALFPKKSGFGTEFYDSRDRMTQCDDIEVSLEDMPNENSTHTGTKKRIVGLGDKIRCMKIKYFGVDPLDSPFFKESLPSDRAKGQDSALEGSQQHVRYEVFHPVSPLASNANATDTRVIPVREHLPTITTSAPIRGMKPPRNSFPYLPVSIISIPKIPKPAKIMTKIKSKYNCLQPVSKMIVSERSDSEDIMYDCPDVTLIQTTLNGNQHFKIIPKNVKRSLSSGGRINQLRAGEVLETKFSLIRRKRSETNARRTSLFPNRSLLDKKINRPVISRRNNGTTNGTTENVTMKSSSVKPDVKPTLPPQTTSKRVTGRISNTTARAPVAPRRPTKTTAAPVHQPAKKTVPKKQTSKLSGLDFLTRYQKAKNSRNKNEGETVNFFKASEAQDLDGAGSETKRKRWISDTEVPGSMLTGGSYMRRSDVLDRSRRRSWTPEPPPVLLYVVDVNTGIGKWISQPIIQKSYTPQNLPYARY